MADVSAAQSAVSFYAQRQLLLRGRVIYVQFSNHDQLVLDDTPLGVGLLLKLFKIFNLFIFLKKKI